MYKIKFNNIRYFEIVPNGIKIELVIPLKKNKVIFIYQCKNKLLGKRINYSN